MNETPRINLSSKELLTKILAILDEKKAQQVVSIDLENKSSISDYLVIASGSSSRQVGALAEYVYREMKQLGLKPTIEGMPQCDWVLVDAGDVIIHMFRPEVRAFYNLEKMWGIDLPDQISVDIP